MPVATKLKKKGKSKAANPLIKTPIGRLVYVDLVTPNKFNGKDNFQLSLLFPKDTWKEKGLELRQAVLMVGRKYFEDDTMTLKDFPNPFRDGDEKTQDFFKGHVYVTPKSSVKDLDQLEKYRPVVVGPDKKEWNLEQIKKIKSGDYARAIVSVYAYNQAGNEGVSLGLSIVQFAREGTAIAAGRSASVALLDEIEVDLDDIDDLTDEEGEEGGIDPELEEELIEQTASTPVAKTTNGINGKSKPAAPADDDDDVDVTPPPKKRAKRSAAAEVEGEDDIPY